jgi:hypothetical protein
MDETTHTRLERLMALADFLRVFTREEFSFGEYIQPEPRDGVMIMGYFRYAPEVRDFTAKMRKYGWGDRNFNWPDWKQTKEAAQLRDDSEILAQATDEQLSKLLTVVIRQDRFVEGGLASAYDSGLLMLWCGKQQAGRAETWRQR